MYQRFAGRFLTILLTSGCLAAQSPGTFSPTGGMTTARTLHTATLLQNRQVLVTGGQVPESLSGGQAWDLLWVPTATAELYDPSTGKFAATGSMAAARAGHQATLLPNGKVLITGGLSLDTSQLLPGAMLANSFAVDTAEIYDPDTGIFSAAGKMITGRFGHTATLLNTGKVLIAGGSRFADDGYPIVASAELYDPTNGAFTAAGNLIKPAWLRTATLLSSGKVLLDGEGDDLAATAELYDPATAIFSLTGANASVNSPYPATASLLPNGKILEILEIPPDPDSCDDFPIATKQAQVYDPSTGTFTSAGNQTYDLGPGSSSTLLPDGTVLIFGDFFGDAELYNAATSTFQPTGGVRAESRTYHTATALGDGTVLIAGGQSSVLILATAELYHPPVLVPSPVLLSLSGNGGGAGAILHGATQQVVSSANPAVVGEILEIYGTGLMDGAVIPPQVAIGGLLGEVVFFGQAPGFAGLYQINVRVPTGVTAGSAIPVGLTYLSRPSNDVSIAVQ